MWLSFAKKSHFTARKHYKFYGKIIFFIMFKYWLKHFEKIQTKPNQYVTIWEVGIFTERHKNVISSKTFDLLSSPIKYSGWGLLLLYQYYFWRAHALWACEMYQKWSNIFSSWISDRFILSIVQKSLLRHWYRYLPKILWDYNIKEIKNEWSLA